MKKGARIAIGVFGYLLIASVAWLFISSQAFKVWAQLEQPVRWNLWLDYWQHYREYPSILKKLKLSGILPAVALALVPVVIMLANLRPKRELHGSARFASVTEVREAGLFSDKGILVGKQGNKYLCFGGAQFVLMAAPTRAGKGVSMVIPNLLSYDGSVVVLDVKQENFDITSGFRKRFGQEVYLFNPFAEDGRTHRYNPLGYVSADPSFRIGDIMAIAKKFYPGDGKDPFWDDQACNLFLGLALFVLETEGLPKTVGEMLRQSGGRAGMPVKDYLLETIETRNASEDPLSADCVNALSRFCSNSDNTLASILASFTAPLGIWANPIVDAATSENDFDLRDVRKRRMSIYIGVTPNNLAQSAKLINVFFSQLVNENTKELPARNPALKYPCLLLMDEFTAIGKVSIIAKAVSYMAGYNLRLLPIIQSKQQLVSVYGQEDAGTFITNHALHVIFAPREQKDAQEFSEMLGYETVKSKSRSRNIPGMNKGGGGRSESESDQRRALMLPQELRELGTWRQIISLENIKPILCNKIRYFDDPVFIGRLKMISPSLAKLGTKMPNKDELEGAAFDGELGVPVPKINVALYAAKVNHLVREVSAEEVTASFDVASLANIDIDAIDTFKPDAVSDPEAQDRFLNDIFKATGIGDVDLASLTQSEMMFGEISEDEDEDDEFSDEDFMVDEEGVEDIPDDGEDDDSADGATSAYGATIDLSVLG